MGSPAPALLARRALAAAVAILTLGVIATGLVADAEPTTDATIVAAVGAPVVPADTVPPPVPAPTTPPTAAPVAAPPAAPPPPPPTTAPPAPAPTAPPQTAPPAPLPMQAPPPPPPPAPSPFSTDCERSLFDRTNATRAANGLPPLAFDSRAHVVSRRWSEHLDTAGDLAHNPRFGPDLTDAGVVWRIAGENVGRGDVDTIFSMWMESPRHRANILSTAYSSFAIGCVGVGEARWVTQNLYG